MGNAAVTLPRVVTGGPASGLAVPVPWISAIVFAPTGAGSVGGSTGGSTGGVTAPPEACGVMPALQCEVRGVVVAVRTAGAVQAPDVGVAGRARQQPGLEGVGRAIAQEVGHTGRLDDGTGGKALTAVACLASTTVPVVPEGFRLWHGVGGGNVSGRCVPLLPPWTR